MVSFFRFFLSFILLLDLYNLFLFMRYMEEFLLHQHAVWLIILHKKYLDLLLEYFPFPLLRYLLMLELLQDLCQVVLF